MVRRRNRQGEVVIWCRKMFWLCATKNGTKTDELLQAAGNGHKRIQKNVNVNSDLGRRQSSPQTRQGIGRLRGKRKESQGRRKKILE